MVSTGINTFNVRQKANGVDPGQIAWEQSNPGPFRLKKRLQKQVLAFQKSWRLFSPIIVCILAHCMLPF